MTVDPVALTQSLVRCASVTPEEGGALTVLRGVLEPLGFRCARADRGGVSNLYARYGDAAPVFAFAGHTDVVPVGARDAWTQDPFGGDIVDGRLYGRGASDMKSGVAAFVAAAADIIAQTPALPGSIALIITGDEEGPAQDGTRALMDWMAQNGEHPDHCLVGEPTCPSQMGEMMKIGRRGSLNTAFTARGVQGHAAYPHRARNPVHALIDLTADLKAWRLDDGTAHFEPSVLSITSFDVGNAATNVIPGAAGARMNIRFNDAHSGASLCAEINRRAAAVAAAHGVDISAEHRISGESFLTPPGRLSDLIANAVEAETGRRPEASTSGGTSDARFLKDLCPVVEFGLVGQTMHQSDENVQVADIRALARIYGRLLQDYFSAV